jgi:SAM-dependent methyltransferase
MLDANTKRNADVWRELYAQGKNDLRYPNDVFIRCCHRYLSPDSAPRVLDYGFGTGANLLHMVAAGFTASGAEISEHALLKAAERLQERGLRADLRSTEPGAALPWPTAYFDAVIAWQVLCYNNWDSWAFAVAELERVLRPGGTLICATTAPGDISQVMADRIGDGLYRSRVPGQEGCIVLIPDEEQLSRCFPGRTFATGEFGYRMGEVIARHWLITYRKD